MARLPDSKQPCQPPSGLGQHSAPEAPPNSPPHSGVLLSLSLRGDPPCHAPGRLRNFLDMAQPKKKPPTNPKKATHTTASADSTSAASAAAPTTRVDTVLQTLLAKAHPLTNDERAVFLAKFSNTQCEAAGAETKSEGVLNDAIGWAPTILKGLADYPKELRRYHPARAAWFLECIRKLADERALQLTKGGSVAVLKTAVERAQASALEARTEVVDTLSILVEGDKAEAQALSDALGSTDRPDRIVASIGTLCTFARRWLARPDALSKKKVELAGLTLAEVETAENAGAALVQATAGKTLEGSLIVRDSVDVNRIEGRVLLEMRAAMRTFNKVNAVNKSVPKLAPGDATRGFLARVGKAAADDAGEDPAAPAADAASAAAPK